MNAQKQPRVESTRPTAEKAPTPRRLPRHLRDVLSLEDFERLAQHRLPRPVFGYISAYADRGVSFSDNRNAFQDYGFLPKVMVDVSQRDLSTTLFGQTYSVPFGFAPMGISALSTYRGDLVLAQAAAQANLPMIMSGSSLIPLETVAARHPTAWFQAYLPGDTASIEALLARIGSTAFKTLVITVDTPAKPHSENMIRSGFMSPLKPSVSLAWQGITHPRWLFGTFLRTLIQHGLPHFENNYAHRGAPILSPSVMRDFADRSHLNWQHLRTIRAQWPGNLIIKGILRPDDARTARDLGADGVIVSNHGGRQLDGAIAPLDALPDVVQACPEIPIMMDSGVRRGTDVLKALALGAKMTFVGRPFGYAAAAGGATGLHLGIDLLTQEISRDMAMLGVTRIDELEAAVHLFRRHRH